jgi:hypothetical protein
MVQKCPQCGEHHGDSISCEDYKSIGDDLVNQELEARQQRIAELERRGAVFNEEGRCWGLAEGAKSTFYDEDGYLM